MVTPGQRVTLYFRFGGLGTRWTKGMVSEVSDEEVVILARGREYHFDVDPKLKPRDKTLGGLSDAEVSTTFYPGLECREGTVEVFDQTEIGMERKLNDLDAGNIVRF